MMVPASGSSAFLNHIYADVGLKGYPLGGTTLAARRRKLETPRAEANEIDGAVDELSMPRMRKVYI